MNGTKQEMLLIGAISVAPMITLTAAVIALAVTAQ